MAHHFYVYYRVRPEASAAAQACVDRLHDAIERRTGVRGRRLARCDEPNLWMEIYERIDDHRAFELLLGEEARQVDLQAHLEPDGRHVECFRD